MISPSITPSRRAILGSAGRVAASLPLLTILGCSPPTPLTTRSQFSGATMGTQYRVTMVGAEHLIQLKQIQRGVERILERVNNQLSTYRADSELSKFNAAPAESWFEVSADVAHLTAKSLEISHRSGGAFDATVGPLVDLWGFGPVTQEPHAPDDTQINEAMSLIGHHHLSVNRSTRAIRKNRHELHLDLSGIGKGSGVDQVADYLADIGVERFLVDIGGDMRVHRRSPSDPTWRIGIERPVIGPRTIHRVIEVGDGAVATSGDYRNFIRAEGAHYSHIIDPRTGSPVRHDLASVTVIAPTAEEADAWSTALMVLGPDNGVALANRKDLAAFFIVRGGNRLIDLASSEFNRFLVTSES